MARRTPARWRTTTVQPGLCVRELWRGPVHLATLESRSSGDNAWRVEVGDKPTGRAGKMREAEQAAKSAAVDLEVW